MSGVAGRIAQVGPVFGQDGSAVKETHQQRSHPTYNSCMDLAALLTEQPNPASAHIDKLPTREMLRVMNREDRKAAEAVEAEIPQIERAIEGIVEAFRKGGKLFYIGAGTSGRLGVLD